MAGMIEPARALVRPRVVSPETGDVVLLEDEAAYWLTDGRSLGLEIVGDPGLGKTTALAHLAAVLVPAQLAFLDDPTPAEARAAMAAGRLLYSAPEPMRLDDTYSLRLASWSDDELIEYLRASHPTQCASVMRRVRACGERRRLHGVPELWRIVLEELAGDEAAHEIFDALRRRWLADFNDPKSRTMAERYCLAKLVGNDDLALRHVQRAARSAMLRHRVGQVMLAAEHLTHLIAAGAHRWYYPSLRRQLPDDLIDAAASLVAASPPAAEQLRELLTRRVPAVHAMAATLLHAAGVGWKPARGRLPDLSRARLSGAAWPGVDLRRALLNETDLTGADLAEAALDGAKAKLAVFRGAGLGGATLHGIRADHADFSGANLSQVGAKRARFRSALFCSAQLNAADLSGSDFTRADFSHARLPAARFVHADLSQAVFDEADLSGADLGLSRLRKARLSRANLSGARLTSADLTECDLEGVFLPDADMESANLTRADLTGSLFPRANLRYAVLHQAGLADVDWHDADLRNADFSNCAFHLGSSRSGLVGSPIACEGSRTGFYTDDYNEQDFKAPEEIRKADLRGANLQGAIVDRADFYLVDLRGAQYSPDQAEHFRRCGAILFDRVSS